tara:strand:+ start:1135 stop:1569 length:435 start_codon:yes stop_codon:yes gene_type:complete
MSDLKPGEVELKNAAECFGFILSFLAYWSDGKWHEAESEVMFQAIAGTLKNLELDSDGDGDVDVDDLKASIARVNESFANCTFDEASHHLKGICIQYFGEWSDDNKQVILNRSVDLVKADGEVTDVEKGNVNFVASCLGLEKPF